MIDMNRRWILLMSVVAFAFASCSSPKPESECRKDGTWLLDSRVTKNAEGDPSAVDLWANDWPEGYRPDGTNKIITGSITARTYFVENDNIPLNIWVRMSGGPPNEGPISISSEKWSPAPPDSNETGLPEFIYLCLERDIFASARGGYDVYGMQVEKFKELYGGRIEGKP